MPLKPSDLFKIIDLTSVYGRLDNLLSARRTVNNDCKIYFACDLDEIKLGNVPLAIFKERVIKDYPDWDIKFTNRVNSDFRGEKYDTPQIEMASKERIIVE